MHDHASREPIVLLLSETVRAHDEWDKSHGSMKEKPPCKGRVYVKHALTLLSFLEPVSEAHPALKAVVSAFKFVLRLENEREENDARVSSVLLAQTDMLRVLLDLDDVKRRSRTAHAEAYDRVSLLSDRIQKDIMACGSDTEIYYEESKLGKFFKSTDWKERLQGYIATFDEHRKNLQLALLIRITASMDDLHAKMDTFLNLIFTRNTWEKEVASKVCALGGQEAVLRDTIKLEQLARETEGESVKSGHGYLALKLEDMHQSLDDLCKRNQDASGKSHPSGGRGTTPTRHATLPQMIVAA